MPLFQRTEIRVPTSVRAVTAISEHERAGQRGGISPEGVREIERALKQLYRTGAYPGIAFCLRHRGELVFDRAIGHGRGNGPQDPPNGPRERLTTDTPICLFSASKAVTAVLIHKLAEEGGIALEQRVSHYIPEFAQAGKGATTVADVLSHRSGFPTMRLPKPQRQVELLNDWDRVIDLICEAPPVHGRKMAYHAMTGGFILAEILQRVTGAPIQKYLDAKFRKPMGLRQFHYGVKKADRERVALNYVAGAPVRFPVSTVAENALFVPFDEVVRASNSEAFMQAVIPAGNLYANAEETGRFFQMLLDGGVWNGKRLIAEATVERALRPVGRMSFDRTLMVPMRYSEGMMLGANPAGLYGPNTPRAFGHLGFMNILGWADPQRNLAAALLTTGKAILGTHLIALARLLATIAKHCD